jgi:hypothetical protein
MAKRTKKKKRVCQYRIPDNPEGICGIPLSGRGPRRWCPEHAKAMRKSQTRAAVQDFRARYEPLTEIRASAYRVADIVQKGLAKLDPRAVPRRAGLLAAARAGTDPTYLEPRVVGWHTLLEDGIHAYSMVEVTGGTDEFVEFGEVRFGFLSMKPLPISPLDEGFEGHTLKIFEDDGNSPLGAVLRPIVAEARANGWTEEHVIRFNRLPPPRGVDLNGGMLFSLLFLAGDITLGVHVGTLEVSDGQLIWRVHSSKETSEED